MPENTASAKVKTVLEYAREEATRRGDRRIGTDHLLLALLRDAAAPPARALGVTLAEGRAALDSLDREALAAVGVHIDGLPLTTGAARGRRWITLNSAARATVVGAKEASERERRGRRMEPRHLLSALLGGRHPDPAADLLSALGLEGAGVRERLAAA
jgi:ATP-dependent Clp protease ATP-binding subunit ClpA